MLFCASAEGAKPACQAFPAGLALRAERKRKHLRKRTWLPTNSCFSPATAQRMGIHGGDVVRLEISTDGASISIELPAFLQPGQHDEAVAVALGYGRQGTERFAATGPKWIFARPGVGADGHVGKNAAPFLTLRDGHLQYVRGGIRVTSTGRRSALASTQGHHSLTMP